MSNPTGQKINQINAFRVRRLLKIANKIGRGNICTIELKMIEKDNLMCDNELYRRFA